MIVILMIVLTFVLKIINQKTSHRFRRPAKIKKPILFKSINRLLKHNFSSTQNKWIKKNVKEIIVKIICVDETKLDENFPDHQFKITNCLAYQYRYGPKFYNWLPVFLEKEQTTGTNQNFIIHCRYFSCCYLFVSSWYFSHAFALLIEWWFNIFLFFVVWSLRVVVLS